MMSLDNLNAYLVEHHMLLLFALAALRGKPKTLTRAKELLAFKQFHEAKKLIESMKTIDTAAMIVKAECELELGLISDCQQSCQSVIDSPKAQDLLIELQIRIGNYSEALHLTNIYSKTEKTERIKRLMEIQNDKMKNIDELIQASPLDPSLILVKAEVDWQNRDFLSLNKLHNRLLMMFPDNETVLYRLNVIEMCNMNLTSFPSIQNISVEVFNQSEPTIVLDYFVTLRETAESSCPQQSRFTNFTKLVNARYHRLVGDYNESRTILDLLSETMKKDNSYWQEKALLHLDMHEYDEAIRIFTQLNNDHWLMQARRMKKRSISIDWYAFLGLNRDKNVTQEEIKTAYHKMAKKWHPDLFKDKTKRQEAERLMKRVNCAYDILSDPKLKEAYDNWDGEDEKPQEFNRYDEFMSQIPMDDDDDEERVGPIQIHIEV